MQILFCDKCGMRVSEKDLADGKAARRDERVFCALCSAAPAVQEKSAPHGVTADVPPSAVLRTVPEARASSSILAAARPPAPRSTSRRVVSDKPERPAPKNTTLIAVAAAVPVVLVLGFLLLGRGGSNTPIAKAGGKTAEVSRESVRAPASPAEKTAPPRQQAAPEPVTPPRTVAAPAQPAEESPEKSAQDAYDTLTRFEGLAADDKDGRIKRIEAYLAKHGDTIASVRARRMLNELKAPPKPPAPPPPPVAPEGPAPDANDAGEPSSAGWLAQAGPFRFESGHDDWQGDGSALEHGTSGGRKCIKISNPNGARIRGFKSMAVPAGTLRIKFRYFAKSMDGLEVLVSLADSARPRKNIAGFVQDRWTWGSLTAQELGIQAGTTQHIEIGGNGTAAGALLLLDDVQVESK